MEGPRAQPRLGDGRIAGLVRLGHPFPSLLNAAATLVLATFAGAPALAAVRLSGSMLALQVSIGALNDLVDAGLDSGRKPGKPIPRGMVRPLEAGTITVIGLGLGLGLSAPSGAAAVLLAALGAGCGYAYDLWLSRTAWSWLPLAIALPLVPSFAWVGATGTLPASLLAIVPAGLLAGAGLALGNGIADETRDRGAGVPSAVVLLGSRLAWTIHAGALAGAVAIALLAGPGLGTGGSGDTPWRAAALGTAGVLIALGVALASRAAPAVRERGWETEAVGVALLAVGWLAGVPRS